MQVCSLLVSGSDTELVFIAMHRGIDAEVAEFLAQQTSETQGKVIDDATNRRLRWMIHKRVLVRVRLSSS